MFWKKIIIFWNLMLIMYDYINTIYAIIQRLLNKVSHNMHLHLIYRLIYVDVRGQWRHKLEKTTCACAGCQFTSNDKTVGPKGRPERFCRWTFGEVLERYSWTLRRENFTKYYRWDIHRGIVLFFVHCSQGSSLLLTPAFRPIQLVQCTSPGQAGNLIHFFGVRAV